MFYEFIINIKIALGLDLDKNRVIQVAMLVTDAHLNVISKDFNSIIKQSDEVLEDMDDWCKENLKDLAVSSKNSEISEQKAEDLMLEFVSEYIRPQASPLAGNSIYMDRMFLRKYFPRFDKFLHYRIIDVSSIKELCGRWNRPILNAAPRKKLQHRALEDVKGLNETNNLVYDTVSFFNKAFLTESINELKHYKEKFFVVKST